MYQLAKNTQILNGEILEKMKLSGYPILVIDWYREVELYKEEFLGDVQDHCGRSEQQSLVFYEQNQHLIILEYLPDVLHISKT